MKKQLQIKYEEIISLENLFAAWREFARGKRTKRDVQEFELRLADNILQLHDDLANFFYEHGGYHAFNISDPKPRNIHKAAVRDRVLHRAIYRQLYPFFDRTFIADSFSGRLNKGTHKALNRFEEFVRKVGRNYTRTVWALKCDIKKFFASVDHEILSGILKEYVPDENIIWLLEKVIRSFQAEHKYADRHICVKGLPLGNLTSQLFCNVYMNEFDQFVKHKLKARYYLRYADDFVLFSDNREWLESKLPLIEEFLWEKLRLALHPDKIVIRTDASGVDFLGWVHFPDHRILRSATARRMLKRISQGNSSESLQSYLGLLAHGSTFRWRERIINI